MYHVLVRMDSFYQNSKLQSMHYFLVYVVLLHDFADSGNTVLLSAYGMPIFGCF